FKNFGTRKLTPCPTWDEGPDPKTRDPKTRAHKKRHGIYLIPCPPYVYAVLFFILNRTNPPNVMETSPSASMLYIAVEVFGSFSPSAPAVGVSSPAASFTNVNSPKPDVFWKDWPEESFQMITASRTPSSSLSSLIWKSKPKTVPSLAADASFIAASTT